MGDNTTNPLEVFNKLSDNNTTYLLICFTIVFVILFSLLSWLYMLLNKETKICSTLEQTYKSYNEGQNRTITTSFINYIDVTDPNNNSVRDNNAFKHPQNSILRNYHIKTAFNCCCGDGYKNNFVNKCALLNCITHGARCLDFEIYSYNGEPIVAASTANNNSIKETYNYLPLYEVFEILNANAFYNNKDPMFLHFRIMSSNISMYNKMAEYIRDNLNLGAEYLLSDPKELALNESYNENDMIKRAIRTYGNKFIIMVNQSTQILKSTKLTDYINFVTGTNYFRLLRFEDVKDAGNNNNMLIEDTKNKLTMVLPNVSISKDNFDFTIPLSNGCHFIGMKFQNLDNNMKYYHSFFNDRNTNNTGNYSFILKRQAIWYPLPSPEQMNNGLALEENSGNADPFAENN